jgi:hypothetical protein
MLRQGAERLVDRKRVILSETGDPGARRICACWGGGVDARLFVRAIAAHAAKNPSVRFRRDSSSSGPLQEHGRTSSE